MRLSLQAAGRRSAAALALTATAFLSAPSSVAAPDIENSDDETFARLLDRSGVLFSFNLQKRQGQRYCEDVIDGAAPLDALQDLMRFGGYSFDVANSISAAAGISYCHCANMMASVGYIARPESCRIFENAYRAGELN